MLKTLRISIICIAIMLLIFVFLAAGCGYNFRADGEPLGIQLDSIAIPLVTSTSSEIGFEADFTKIIRNEFINHTNLRLAYKERAQFILYGHIYEISTEPLSFDLRQETVNGYATIYEQTRTRRLKVKLDISLIERASGKVIWHEPNMEEKASFNVGGNDPLSTRHDKQRALERIARQLAKRIFLRTTERF
ncbi:MAG: hypothetical protein JRJ85_00980 [Deltaproteobacteria bacterium]|nr:hypothetical protein [Deltaproteobacteria bacterium]